MGNPALTYDNQGISVDCVVFGFDGESLRVLLARRWQRGEGLRAFDYKLPGSLIADNEDLISAAHRVVATLIGQRAISMHPIEVFSDPKRVPRNDLMWINKFYNVELSRVLTVIYFGLIKLDERLVAYTARNGGEWAILNNVHKLALDHNQILMTGIDHLLQQFRHEPAAFELLPHSFTIRQLQHLYEQVFDTELDNRNFRKKILSLKYIVPLEKHEDGVPHKPALLYRFDKKSFLRYFKKKVSFL